MLSIDDQKRLVGRYAVDDYLSRTAAFTHGAIGIGSGSTVISVVDRLVEVAKSTRPELLQLHYIPTSFQAEQLIVSRGLSLGSPAIWPQLDVVFDGADQCDPKCNVIKGGGACHLQEKIVGSCTDCLILIADSSKLVSSLSMAIPLEVAPCAQIPVMGALRQKFGAIEVSCRQSKAGKAGPIITDMGHIVVDAKFDVVQMSNLTKLDQNLNGIPGVLGTGLFLSEMVHLVYIAHPNGSVSTMPG